MRRSEQFTDVDEEAVGTLFAETVIDIEVSPGALVEFDTEAGAPAGLHGLQAPVVKAREGFAVEENDSAEEAIGSQREAVFRFKIHHLVAAETALDISSAGTGISIPISRGEVQKGRFAAADDQPVIAPEGQYIPGTGGEIEIFAHIQDEGLPIAVTPHKFKVVPVGGHGIEPLIRIDRIIPGVIERVEGQSGRCGMGLRTVLFIIRGDGRLGIDTGDIIPPVYDVAAADVEVVGDPAVDDLIEADVIILHGIDVADPGIGSQTETGLRVFHEVDIADKIELVSFCPDIGLQGNGELFILGVVRAGGDGGDPAGGVEAKGSVASTGDGSPGSQGVSYSREEGNRQFTHILYLV